MGGKTDFSDLYGPWALVAGGSEGLGLAFAEQAARRGLGLLLVARQRERLERAAADLKNRFDVEVDLLDCDLASAAGCRRTIDWVAGRPVGLLVCNAAISPIGEFLSLESGQHLDCIELNCRSTTRLVHHFTNAMLPRGQGGVVIVSSLASFQGTAMVASYAASKAYLRVLAEGLWAEVGPRGVDVLASCPGIVDTPAYRATDPNPPSRFVPAPLDPNLVANETLDYLGHGPVIVPGRANRLANQLTARLVSRRRAIELASSGTRKLYSDK